MLKNLTKAKQNDKIHTQTHTYTQYTHTHTHTHPHTHTHTYTNSHPPILFPIHGIPEKCSKLTLTFSKTLVLIKPFFMKSLMDFNGFVGAILYLNFLVSFVKLISCL